MKIDVSTKSHPNVFAEIDDADFDRISPHRWAATRRRKKLYVRGFVEGRDVFLHRYLMDEPPGLFVDHRDGDPLNNQRGNLRVCTLIENNKFAHEAGVFEHLRKRNGVHTVKRKLADGTVRLHYYDRRTRERLTNQSVNTK